MTNVAKTVALALLYSLMSATSIAASVMTLESTAYCPPLLPDSDLNGSTTIYIPEGSLTRLGTFSDHFDGDCWNGGGLIGHICLGDHHLVDLWNTNLRTTSKLEHTDPPPSPDNVWCVYGSHYELNALGSQVVTLGSTHAHSCPWR